MEPLEAIMPNKEEYTEEETKAIALHAFTVLIKDPGFPTQWLVDRGYGNVECELFEPEFQRLVCELNPEHQWNVKAQKEPRLIVEEFNKKFRMTPTFLSQTTKNGNGLKCIYDNEMIFMLIHSKDENEAERNDMVRLLDKFNEDNNPNITAKYYDSTMSGTKLSFKWTSQKVETWVY